MKIELNEQDINNLNVFLDRVEFKGRTEAVALLRISNAINQVTDQTETKEGENNG